MSSYTPLIVHSRLDSMEVYASITTFTGLNLGILNEAVGCMENEIS